MAKVGRPPIYSKEEAANRKRHFANRRSKKYRGKLRDKIGSEGVRLVHLWYRYKLTPEQVETLEREHGGLCAICKRERPLHFDHDHITNRIRGMLCGSCNRGLGMYDDSPTLLRLAAEYLEARA